MNGDTYIKPFPEKVQRCRSFHVALRQPNKDRRSPVGEFVFMQKKPGMRIRMQLLGLDWLPLSSLKTLKFISV